MGATLALAAAAILLWQGRAKEAAPVPAQFAARAATVPPGGVLPEAPSADERTREQKRFDRLDKDRNERIDMAEYFAARRKAFAKLDANGDGRLVFEEWAVKARDKFAKADGDRSAWLTRAEFATTAVVRKARAKPKCVCPPVVPARGEDEE